jgi:hypothetical protein
MSKFKTINSFFKRKEANISKSNTPLDFNGETSNHNEHHLQSPRVEDEEHPFESLIAETQEIYFKLSTLNVRGKYVLTSSTITRLRFSHLKYQKLLNGPPNYQTVTF